MALRRWTAADADWYVACSRDAQVQRFTTNPADLTVAHVRTAIEESGRDPHCEAFLVVRAEDGTRLGNVAVELVDGPTGACAEVSYWVAAQARGAGVAAHALELVCRWLAHEGTAGRAELWTHRDNAASRRAAERAGFVRNTQGDRDLLVKGCWWPTVAYRRSPLVPLPSR